MGQLLPILHDFWNVQRQWLFTLYHNVYDIYGYNKLFKWVLILSSCSLSVQGIFIRSQTNKWRSSPVLSLLHARHVWSINSVVRDRSKSAHRGNIPALNWNRRDPTTTTTTTQPYHIQPTLNPIPCITIYLILFNRWSPCAIKVITYRYNTCDLYNIVQSW